MRTNPTICTALLCALLVTRCGGARPAPGVPDAESEPGHSEPRALPNPSRAVDEESSSGRERGPSPVDDAELHEAPADEADAVGGAPAPAVQSPSGAKKAPGGTTSEELLTDAEQAQLSARDAFVSALAAAAPDCEGARGFRDAVCSLAERICALTGQAPSSLAARCDDGRRRCAQSRLRYSRQCE